MVRLWDKRTNTGAYVNRRRSAMKDNTMKIEQRLQNMKKLYNKIGDMIDKLPNVVPEQVRNLLKNQILGDTELKNLMEGIDFHRPPRIFLIGRTGVGKSSLINALCNTYIAAVDDTKSCTENVQVYKCMDGERVLMEILDTRGIAESESLNNEISAEDMLINQINEFSPDVAIFMLSCTHRDDINSDVLFLKKLAKSYADINNLRLPIITVINKCDEMSPARLKVPSQYSQNKIDNINKVVQNYKSIIVRNGLQIDDIIAVSSLIDWKTPDELEINAENINNLPKSDIENLQIAFDGRYNIEKLFDIMEEAIHEFDAKMGLRMATRLTEVVHRMAKHLNRIFSGISATVALSPIPISDIYVLLIIQAILVCLIASLSGRDISLETGKEFILSMGGITGVGYSFKLFSQQVSKLLNVVVPGSGSVASSSIAYAGTSAIGKAAISYYIDGKDLKEAKMLFKKEKKE